jgi:hypothetical protein
MRLLEKIYTTIYLNYILFWLLYIPMVLVVYLSDKISDAYKNWDSTTEDDLLKKLFRFGIICLSIGLVIGFAIGWIIK